MKKLMLIFLTVILIVSVQAATQEERQAYKECNLECKNVKSNSVNECSLEFSQCKAECDNVKSCVSECSKEKRSCLKQTNEQQNECKLQCKQILTPKCFIEDKTYLAGEKIQNECDICECKKDGKVTCKREPFCNKDPTITESECVQTGGLYQSLCKGSFFDIMCTPEKYCLCQGNLNYTCPSNYECLKNFDVKIRKSGLPEIRDMLGVPLGNIGICVSNSTQDQ